MSCGQLSASDVAVIQKQLGLGADPCRKLLLGQSELRGLEPTKLLALSAHSVVIQYGTLAVTFTRDPEEKKRCIQQREFRKKFPDLVRHVLSCDHVQSGNLFVSVGQQIVSLQALFDDPSGPVPFATVFRIVRNVLWLLQAAVKVNVSHDNLLFESIGAGEGEDAQVVFIDLVDHALTPAQPVLKDLLQLLLQSSHPNPRHYPGLRVPLQVQHNWSNVSAALRTVIHEEYPDLRLNLEDIDDVRRRWLKS